MMDIFKTILKAARLAKKRRPISATLALHDILTPPSLKARRKAAKPANRQKTAAKRPAQPAPGSFSSAEFRCPYGTLNYKLYMPTGSARRRMPLMVMTGA